jgi:hypothetical protein
MVKGTTSGLPTVKVVWAETQSALRKYCLIVISILLVFFDAQPPR